jgi:Xaa-Pro dipeptidase
MFRVPKAELERRIGEVQGRLRSAGVDFAVIVQNTDLYYLTGTVQQGHLVLPAEGEPVFFVRRDVARAQCESELDRVVELTSLRALPEVVGRMGLPADGTVGMELDVVPVAMYRRYEAMWPAARFADCSDPIKEARSVKSAFELELIREASAQADHILETAAGLLHEGMTEIEMAAELEAVARKAGHQGIIRFRAFNMELYHGHLISGPDGAIGSHVDTPLAGRGLTPAVAQGAGWRTIGRNEPIVFDLSGAVHGYIADETRIFCVGSLPADLADAYERVREMEQAMVALVRPGITCGELYATAHNMAAEQGLGAYFMGAHPTQVSFVGHGVGLEIDELPFVARGSSRALEEGNVIALEPKLAFPERGAVGLENTWLVTADEAERLTNSPTEIWEV